MIHIINCNYVHTFYIDGEIKDSDIDSKIGNSLAEDIDTDTYESDVHIDNLIKDCAKDDMVEKNIAGVGTIETNCDEVRSAGTHQNASSINHPCNIKPCSINANHVEVDTDDSVAQSRFIDNAYVKNMDYNLDNNHEDSSKDDNAHFNITDHQSQSLTGNDNSSCAKETDTSMKLGMYVCNYTYINES